jgi:hypothetical protein
MSGNLSITANPLPVSPGRAEVLSPARLWGLYEHQNLPVTEIAALAGCATITIPTSRPRGWTGFAAS